MSRWGIDPPDDDAYDVRHDGTACEDCGSPSVAWLCETCSDRRESWAAAAELRMTEAREADMQQIVARKHAIVAPKHEIVAPAVVEVALVPVSTRYLAGLNPVVDVALVPMHTVVHPHLSDARFLKRMAKAILSADLSNVKDVA